jgi:hypothetical protein
MNENKEIIRWLKERLEEAKTEKAKFGSNIPLYSFWDGKEQTIEETLSKLGVIVEVNFKQTSNG